MKIFYWIDVALFLGFAGFVASLWSWDVRYLTGISVAAVCFMLWMMARRQLGESFSIGARAKALVTTGLYSKFRHPIYLFGELAFIGLFIAWGNRVGILYFAVASSILLLRIRNEEAVLEKSFGENYRRYKASTWL